MLKSKLFRPISLKPAAKIKEENSQVSNIPKNEDQMEEASPHKYVPMTSILPEVNVSSLKREIPSTLEKSECGWPDR